MTITQRNYNNRTNKELYEAIREICKALFATGYSGDR